MRPPLSLRLALAVGFACSFFTIGATQIFLRWTGLLRYFDWPIYQYWSYLAEYISHPDPRMKWYLILSAAGALLPIVFVGLGLVMRYHPFLFVSRSRLSWRPPNSSYDPPLPLLGATDNHGHARWATVPELRRLWPAADAVYGGVVVGEAYDPRVDKEPFSPTETRTWGHGGNSALLIDPCKEGSTHSMIVAGSGSYKTVSAVSTLLAWRGSAVVLDPASELAPMLEADRRRMGHRVFVLRPETAAACGFNVLDWIDTDSPIAETDVAAVVEWTCGYTPRRDATAEFFKNQGKSLVTCLLAHMLWDPDLSAELKTLQSLRRGLSVAEPALRKMLKQIHRASKSRLARDLAGPLSTLVDETFSGVVANANEDTKWLSTTTYAELVSGNSFATRDIAAGDTDVFVSLPLKALQATPAVARCIIGALLNAAYEADGNIRGRILFLLDEAARLGRMEIIEVARDAGRKYGITLHLLYQSIGQIEQQWGREGKRAWYESLSWRAYAAVKDLETARELSETIGNYGVMSWSASQRRGGFNQGGRNITYNELSRRLIRQEEIMHDLREDAQIIIPKNGRPALCGRAIYFRRPEFVARVNINRFARAQEEIECPSPISKKPTPIGPVWQPPPMHNGSNSYNFP